MHWRVLIEELLKEKSFEEATLLLAQTEKEEGKTVFLDTYAALIRLHQGERAAMQDVFAAYPGSYVPCMYYSEYLVEEKKIEESVKYYEAALKLCTHHPDIERILRKLILCLVYVGKVAAAFAFTQNLLQLSSVRYNVVLLWFVCKAGARMNYTPDLKKGMKQLEDTLGQAVGRKPKAQECLRYRNVEVRAQNGFSEFIKKNSLSLDLECLEASAEQSSFESPYDALIDRQEYLAVFQKYAADTTGPCTPEQKCAVALSLQMLIKAEDVLLLFKIGNSMYFNELYKCSRYLYRMIIDIFLKVHTLRYMSLQICVNRESALFGEVASLSPMQSQIFRDSIKRYNTSVLFAKHQKGRTLEEIEHALAAEFSKMDVESSFNAEEILPTHKCKE
ncbi:hypothetical protein NECID01_0606 [Nematocida sp. AWRm77]|nr:hypothetical protein NECID01_0606 [Nematocida sp. AWRm77]